MFQPIESNPSVYKKVVTQIQNMILKGELKSGDRLPPERQLAEMMGVGRPALKQALSALEMMGIVQSRQGDGNYITSNYIEFVNPLAIRFYLEKGNENDITEFRYMMEVQMAALAAAKITETQKAEFQELMDEIREKVTDSRELSLRQHYNNKFHMKIVEICGNHLIISIYKSIMSLISDNIRSTDGSFFYESHEKIFRAICSGDPDKAAAAMAEHFENKFPNYQYYQVIYREKPAEENQ